MIDKKYLVNWSKKTDQLENLLLYTRTQSSRSRKNKMSGFFMSDSKGSASKPRKRQAKSSQVRRFMVKESILK